MTEGIFREYARFCAAPLSGDSRNDSPFSCPITGYPCEGDLSHLCEEYGCARKAGLSAALR
jgi:hypothetical protein